jgi:hypothetical protein
MTKFIATIAAFSAFAAAIVPASAGFGPSDVRSFEGPAFGPADIRSFEGPAFGPADIRSFEGPARVTWIETLGDRK